MHERFWFACVDGCTRLSRVIVREQLTDVWKAKSTCAHRSTSNTLALAAPKPSYSFEAIYALCSNTGFLLSKADQCCSKAAQYCVSCRVVYHVAI